jgi:hypothetical protein
MSQMSVDEQETAVAMGGMEVFPLDDGRWSWRQKLFRDDAQGGFPSRELALMAASRHATTIAMADNDLDEAAWDAKTSWQRAKLVWQSWRVPSDLVLAA